jgi:hypothetical protein
MTGAIESVAATPWSHIVPKSASLHNVQAMPLRSEPVIGAVPPPTTQTNEPRTISITASANVRSINYFCLVLSVSSLSRIPHRKQPRRNLQSSQVGDMTCSP